MGDWFKRVSATAAGRILALALVGDLGVGTLLFASWAYIKDAPWPVHALITVSVFLLNTIALIFLWAFLQAPPSGLFTPRHLRRFKLPIRRVSWDFDNYLGMGSGTGQPVLIYMFQPRLRVNWGDGIKPLRAWIECSRTGQRRDILVECGNPYVNVSNVAFIPSGAWFHCQGWFSEKVTDSTDPLSRESLFQMFPDFRLTFEYEGGSFTRFFSHRELSSAIDRFRDYSNRLPRPRPTRRRN